MSCSQNVADLEYNHLSSVLCCEINPVGVYPRLSFINMHMVESMTSPIVIT